MVFTIDDRIQLERQHHQDLKIGVLTCDRDLRQFDQR